MKCTKLAGMLNPLCKFNLLFAYHSRFVIGDKNGNIKAEVPNPAVDSGLLCEILSWTKENASCDDVIEWLRTCTVPSGYTYHNWIDS